MKFKSTSSIWKSKILSKDARKEIRISLVTYKTETLGCSQVMKGYSLDWSVNSYKLVHIEILNYP